jgi:thiamine-monophosphate kinase
LTGPVGGSALGRHLAIEPRLEAGRALWLGGARVLMDVSDGLGLDLTRIAAASGVRIELECLPIHPHARRAARTSGRTAQQHTLEDGEDHELIAVLPEAAARRLLETGLPGAPRALRIGRVRAGSGLFVPSPEGALTRFEGGGYWHGRAGRARREPGAGRPAKQS